MTGIAVVASKHDAQFAEEVRTGLQASPQHDVSLVDSLPGSAAGSFVVLIWSAALEAGHAIDVQALVGLWSEGRLLIVRRDAAPLPLGMRDLPSLPPDKSAADVCAALSKSEPSARAPARSPIIAVLVASMSIGIALGGWYYFTAGERARQAELTAMLETAAKASADLKQAQTRQLEALKELEARRLAEAAVLKSGDAAKINEAQEAIKRAEAEAAKQVELVKQFEATASKVRDDARKAMDAAKQTAAEAVKAEAKQEVAVVAPTKAPETVKVEVRKPAAESKSVIAPKASEAPKAMTRSERERLRDEEAAVKALAAAGKSPTQVAAVSPSVAGSSPSASPSASAPAPATKGADAEVLYQQAFAMESEGKAAQSVRIYRRAARAGSGKAAKRLGEIFDKGVPGVSRDYAESLQWYETARQLGETIELSGRREAQSVPEIAAKSAPPAPVAAVPDAIRAAAPAPVPDSPKTAAPAPTPPAAPPAASTESQPWYAVIIAIALLAMIIVLWRRFRRRPDFEAAQRQPRSQTARPAAQPPADAATLFVSYSHKDRPRVEPIVSLMEGMGRRVWMDRTDITGQTGWAGQIVRAIRECRAVVLMASPNSYSSDQVVRELYLAMNHKKTIVPIEIEPAVLPDELQYILAPFQHHRLSGGETREVLGRALAAV